MGELQVGYRRGAEGTADTDTGLSGFWGDCPILTTLENRRRAYGHIDNGMGVPVVTADGPTGAYEVEITTTAGSPQFGTDAVVGGSLILQTGTGDNDETLVVHGGNESAQFRISDALTEARKLWFEVAVLPDLITATQNGFFAGLCENFTAAANGLIDDGGGLNTDRDLIGFFKREGDAGLVDFVYQKGSQTIQIILNAFKTLNTTTAVKFGFVYDPAAPDSEKIRIYTDGIPESTFVTAALIAVSASTGFPNGILMAPSFNVKTATAAVQTYHMPFWGCYQLV